VAPGARSSQIGEVADGRLRVRLAAPAQEGRANDELVKFVAKTLDVPRGAVTLIAGGRSRRKLLHLTGVNLDEARRRLGL
jgi:uncharacterized protein (TIGR00251 family)